MKDILKGQWVKLAATDPEEASKSFVRWQSDSEFKRLLDSGAVGLNSTKAIKEFIEKESDQAGTNLFWFVIRSLEDDRLLGDVLLDVGRWNMREGFVGIGLGDRDFWGKGYGTEAMQLILQFAFTEVNLRRVSLNVFEYNPRAIRSYEKVGFQHEGRLRGALLREGRRWDMLFMGILREEWTARYLAISI